MMGLLFFRYLEKMLQSCGILSDDVPVTKLQVRSGSRRARSQKRSGRPPLPESCCFCPVVAERAAARPPALLREAAGADSLT
jgi:hypothetical protein